MKAWKYHIDTFGCKTNQYESQAIREAWNRLGGTECQDSSLAEVVCINSCAVTARAERDARNAVFRHRRNAPLARIILTGCAARLFAEFRPRKGAFWAQPDLLVPQGQKASLLAGPHPGDAGVGHDAIFSGISTFRRARAVVKVQDGCSQACAYCIVPSSRGAPRSRAPDEVLAEADRLASAGFPEIVISGINLRQYGAERPEYGDFWNLMSFVDNNLMLNHGHRVRLRISSLDPAQLDDRGVDILTGMKLVCPHIHLSLQHASQGVLERMGRRHYDPAATAAAVRKLAKVWPVMGLGADLLVGFPDEKEDDFGLLLEYVQAIPLTYAHVFPFSPRPGTVAARLSGQLARKVRQQRAQRLRQAVAAKKRAFLASIPAGLPMQIVADSTSREGTLASGVNQWYTRCYFPWPGDIPPSGFVNAVSAGVRGEGLLAQPAPPLRCPGFL